MLRGRSFGAAGVGSEAPDLLRSGESLMWTLHRSSFHLLVLTAIVATGASAQVELRDPASLGCPYRPPARWVEELRAAAEKGEVVDPRERPIPPIAPRPERHALGGGPPCLTNEHVFAYEDTARLLLTDFSDGQLIALMVDAANALLAE